MLLAHMLKSDDVIRKVLDRIGIEFNIDSHRALATYIYALYEEGKEPTPQHLMNRIEDDVMNQLLTDILMIQVGDELSEAELSDYVKKSVESSEFVNDKGKKTRTCRSGEAKRFLQSGNTCKRNYSVEPFAEVIRLLLMRGLTAGNESFTGGA
ncbi:hypothetical protein BsIDN1_44000 [Bacillus safensis]|uniref:Uncharacterized protein n=1 Tax=Bacillus safensis TaxID=561879 RepID=A0A5S9MDW9_BACIA|nr:hypothetical protein BsIDN1_44000 [Bacillus safensis]